MTQQPALFRQQAIDFQRDRRQWGEVALLQPPSTKITVWSLIASVAVLIAFLLMAPYARKETVPGFLMPNTGIARVHAPQPGIVGAIYVEDGQQVEEGQPLLSVATAQIAAEGGDVNVAILEGLARQKALLASQVAAEEQRAVSDERRLRLLLEGLGSEISYIESQIATQRERIALAETLVAAGARLNPRGFVSDVELTRREEMLLEHRQNLGVLGQQLAARRNQLTEHRFTLEQLPIVTADRIRLLRGEITAAEQRIAEVGYRRAYVIRAPIAGRVSALQATVGQTADPRRLLLSLLPRDGTLQAELFVPTRAAGFVRAGQHVRILYEAFPYQNFGAYGGRITRISHTVLTAADAAGPIELREPAYRVTATLDRPDVDAYGQRMPLQPDMLLRADIILDRRPLMAWIANPLLAAATRAVQE